MERFVLPALLLAAACAQAGPDPKRESEPTDAEKAAAAAADKLYDFLRGLDMPKKRASDAANAYETFRLRPEAERKKETDEIGAALKEKDQDCQKQGIKDYLESKGLARGSGLWVNADNIERTRVEVAALEKKDPKGYEALLKDAEARARLLKRHGFTKDDLPVIEPYVFGDTERKAAEKRLRDAMKAAGLDEKDLYWLLKQVPALPDLVAKKAEEPAKER